MKIQKKDYHRVLLTEVLPYEVPIWFSNNGFYRYYRDDKPTNAPLPIRALFDIGRSRRIFSPYKYKIRKNLGGTRLLSIIHPLKQFDFVEFYEKYDQIMLSFCNKSPVTIRHPRRVASNFFDSRLKKKVEKIIDDEVDINKDGFSEDRTYSSSYFSYSRYSFLYKFFDSYHFHTLEKKFPHIMRFDIGNCFNSVYTHSIAWSAKSKEVVKETIDHHSFELTFDKIMQSTKARETNGIVIGPEVSRIFAEIILQKIDLDILAEVEIKLGLRHDVHYSIRRYIDDYFTFTVCEGDSLRIKKIAEDMLERYNFNLNPSKTKTLPVPYVSDLSIAKIELNPILEELNGLLDKMIGTDSGEIPALRASDHAAKLIHRIKSIIVKSGIGVDSISTFLLVRLRGIIFKFFAEIKQYTFEEKKREQLGNFAFMFFDVFFYFLSVDTRPRSTFILSHIVSEVTTLMLLTEDKILNELVFKKISDELNTVVNKVAMKEGFESVELLNLLYIQKQLSDKYLYSPDKFIKLTDLEKNISNNKLQYFQIIATLLYVRSSAEYAAIKNKVCDYVVELYAQNHKFIDQADGFCLLLDFLSCPDVDFKYKDNVALSVFSSIGKSPSPKEREQCIRYVSKRQWFTSWSNSLSRSTLLQKFELNPCY